MAVWAEERDVDAASTLAACGLPDAAASDAASAAVQQHDGQATEQAFEAGVFGAPSRVIDGELFGGQDHLGFVEHRRFAPAAPS